VTSADQPEPAWILSAAKWITLDRVRAQAAILAICLWGVCAVDFATPGFFDRAGNIKFQDFLPLFVSAQLIAHGQATRLYNQQGTTEAVSVVIPGPIRVRLPNLYGPQVGLFFVPLTRFSFPAAARIWATASIFIFAFCVYLVWRCCPGLHLHPGTVFLCAIAFPPLFHFFVRGQTSAAVLGCFTAAFLAFRTDRQFLAGVALGFLVFKPQFVVAMPLVFLLSQSWKPFAGLVLSAGAQVVFARIYFGPVVMRAYFDTLLHISRSIRGVELSLAPIQMHSLRAFWTLVVPAPTWALALYLLSSIVVVAIAAAIWKSSAPLALRFSALVLAAVLANPHLFVYDLLVAAPVLLLLIDWSLTQLQPVSSSTLRLLLYLAYLLPLLGPISQWTHLQLSVLDFAALLWLLRRYSRMSLRPFASNESAIV